MKKIQTKDDLDRMTKKLRFLSANEKSDRVMNLIEEAIENSYRLKHSKAIVNLYELKIKQLFENKEAIPVINKTLQNMKSLSEEIDYLGGLVLCYSIEWGLEKFKGNRIKSRDAIHKAMDLLETANELDSYVYNVSRYSFALEIWLENHDFKSACILEDCVSFFLKEKNYKGLIHSLGYLSIIYSHSQNRQKAIKTAQRIISSKIDFSILPREFQAIAYFFVGVAFKLESLFTRARDFFLKAKHIFEQNNLIYSQYYIPTLSHLLAVKALLGDLKSSYKEIERVECLLEDDSYKSLFDKFNENQIKHTFNLTKFYILSRISEIEKTKNRDLVSRILKGCKVYHSNFMFLSEFIRSNTLSNEDLKEMFCMDNFSINRVKHIIRFMLEKQDFTSKINKEQRILNCIDILKDQLKSNKTTFIENSYSDLLIARQLFSLKRFAEIYPLLRKYEKQLHRIEVLELRIFMEAFIQMGAYKSGDPLGPALQYLAIKKCRTYGFSRLESILLNYLEIQKQEVLGLVV
ncbi:MAG: hypothetical protein ACFFDS_02225 [Candidatus Thorarchaeota archaeon]